MFGNAVTHWRVLRIAFTRVEPCYTTAMKPRWLPLMLGAAACSSTPSGSTLASTMITAQISTSSTITGQVVLGLSPYGAPPNTTEQASCLILRSDVQVSANSELPVSSAYGDFCENGSDGVAGECFQPSFQFQLGSWPSTLDIQVADPTATRVVELTASTTSGVYTVTHCDFTSCDAI